MNSQREKWLYKGKEEERYQKSCKHTHTHTHTHIYIYIYMLGLKAIKARFNISLLDHNAKKQH